MELAGSTSWRAVNDAICCDDVVDGDDDNGDNEKESVTATRAHEQSH